MLSSVQKTEVPNYAEASKRRASGEFSALDFFVSEWEPRLTDNDQYVIDRWREDLSWVTDQVQDDQARSDWASFEEEVDRRFIGYKTIENLVLILLSAFIVSVIGNIVLVFAR